MTMESSVCYICCDRRRTADTDTSLSKTGIRHDSETLKEVLLRALSVGYVEDNLSEVETSRTSYDANRCERRTDNSEKNRQLEFGGDITRDSLQFSDFDLEADSESSATEQSNIPERKKYNRKRIHRCSECAKLFPSQAHLKEHKVSHSNEQSFTCSICLKGFKRKNALNKHMRVLHPNGAEKIFCTCGRIFASKELMYKHQAGSGSHRLLVCPICGALYKTRQSLESHMLLHKESKCYGKEDSWPFTCSLCNERFSSKASLSNHIVSTHSNQDFKCTLCEKTCKTKQLLSQHLLRKHKLGSTEYPCPVCSKVFLIAKDLRRHVQSHNLGGSHECALCHAKFKSYPTLQAHMKIHSKGKPYDCVICLVPFASVEALKDHFIQHHGVKINDDNFIINWNRKCPLCSQVFMRRAGLAVHIKTHFDFEDTEILLVEDDEDGDIENTVAVLTEGNGSSENPGKFQESSNLTVITEESNRNEYSGKIEENSTITVFTGQENSEYSRIIQDKSDFTCELQENTLNKNHYIKCDGEVRLLKEVDNVNAKGISVLINSFIRKSEVECSEVTCDKENTKKLLDHSSNNEDISVPNKEVGGCNSKEEKLFSEREKEIDSEGTKTLEDVNLHTTRNHINEEEETKYICGQCSSVFLDMEDLQTHLLTCYQQDTDDDYVVVFEVDESNVN
ncbi:zinc finger protein 260-like isoform X2 [Penaeus monodon]|uniref:zinc finger protein 260-like isoform X2 n=1 Tax=Penaeus monodon TaxID=6687 RepID=UPI0018A72D61|nr:zinc finger protein 260-like isoform X2 [Penaeus monodon]